MKPVIRNHQYMFVDVVEPNDIECGVRPSIYHEWDGSKWVENIELYNNGMMQQRESRYKTESDQLKIEADYDAIMSDGKPDYKKWLEAVQKIKKDLQYKR